MFNLHHKLFRPVTNSEAGEVDNSTLFRYEEEGSVVTATYSGGSIRSGHIIARYKAFDELVMYYHCLTSTDALKAGKAIAKLSFTDNGRIQMHLHWQWLDENQASGVSHYIEVDY